MAGINLTYTRLVNWLKIILPVTALALLSTMFLISKSVDPTTSLTYARINLDELAGDERISNARFSSVTEDGASLYFLAKSAAPEDAEHTRFRADGLEARIETPDGAKVDINAATAMIDGVSNEVALSGGVTLDTSTHFHIETERLVTAMDATRVETDGPVSATAPMGQLTAGKAEISRAEGEDGAYVLVFKDRVKLIYVPQPEGKKP